jgi:hypothetical protein
MSGNMFVPWRSGTIPRPFTAAANEKLMKENSLGRKSMSGRQTLLKGVDVK